MSEPPASDAAESALCDFHVLWRTDRAGGVERPLCEYLLRFPGHQVEIAREYLTCHDWESTQADPRSDGAADGLGVARTTIQRYEVGAGIGRGGMGAVHLARDLDLDRPLAMKILHRDGPRARGRFLVEARIMSRLDHPGVVPIHDVGLDAHGRPFYTMKHVEGLDLEQAIERALNGDAEWTRERVLEALIKVCDTMSFAHSRGVLHRDIKPDNVRVGRFGEVFVMDWGLARRLEGGAQDGADPEVTGEAATEADARFTLRGDVLGTLAYMSPEQAAGGNAELGPSSDVYSLGAMLYQLLTGRRPYASTVREHSSAELLQLVRANPPVPARELAPLAPAALVAICERAMSREPRARYPDMDSIARDLRAFLMGGDVSAHRVGALERARRWGRRHPGVVAAGLTLVLFGIVATLLIQREQTRGRLRLLQLARMDLVEEFGSLWPAEPANLGAIRSWLASAREVLATRAEDLARLAEMKARALPMDPEAPAERRARRAHEDYLSRRRALIRWFEEAIELADRGDRPLPGGRSRDWFQNQVEFNRVGLQRDIAKAPEHLTFRFADPDEQVRFQTLTQLVELQERLAGHPDFNVVAHLNGGVEYYSLVRLADWGLAAAQRVGELSLEGGRAAWSEARRSIADPAQCPMYRGLELEPQLGLVPLGRDPGSGLWEFAHVLSGTVPERDGAGRLNIDESTCIVLVLVPGGQVLRGSQGESRERANFDPWSDLDSPLAEAADLEPFFLSKYELTQAQWERVTGGNLSRYQGKDALCQGNMLHPVERVSYDDARRTLPVLGLDLPFEAQWEWAARAGTTTPWSFGEEPLSALGHANVADERARSLGIVPPESIEATPGLDDGFPVHAPIGSFASNAYGLHDMLGNVREWCRDTGPFAYGDSETSVATGERLYGDSGTRTLRGGSYALSVLRARSAARDQTGPTVRGIDTGVRPARALDR